MTISLHDTENMTKHIVIVVICIYFKFPAFHYSYEVKEGHAYIYVKS